jgi:hypothetical protein
MLTAQFQTGTAQQARPAATTRNDVRPVVPPCLHQETLVALKKFLFVRPSAPEVKAQLLRRNMIEETV